MSAEIKITPSLADAHGRAVDQLNRWRGHCIEIFARLEEAATLTIASLPLPAGERRPTVFGARMKVLRAALVQSSCKLALKLIADLDMLQADLNWRNRIVHAASSVYVGKDGEWLWLYRFQPSKTGALAEIGTLDKATGTAMEKRLSSSVQSLTARLANLRADPARTPPTRTPATTPPAAPSKARRSA